MPKNRIVSIDVERLEDLLSSLVPKGALTYGVPVGKAFILTSDGLFEFLENLEAGSPEVLPLTQASLWEVRVFFLFQLDAIMDYCGATGECRDAVLNLLEFISLCEYLNRDPMSEEYSRLRGLVYERAVDYTKRMGQPADLFMWFYQNLLHARENKICSSASRPIMVGDFLEIGAVVHQFTPYIQGFTAAFSPLFAGVSDVSALSSEEVRERLDAGLRDWRDVVRRAAQ